MKKCNIYLFICLLGIVVTNSAVAQTKSTLLRSGSSNNKLDVVIIGDGFTSSEQSDYNDYVKDIIMDEAFANDIFSEIKNAFNIHRVNAISNDSDVTRVDADGNVTIERDTALDYQYSGN